jgi:single-strand DNA-binding protein
VNVNKVFIGGHMTRDCELRYTPNGTAVGQFGVAVNRSWKNDAGEKQEEVTFVDCDTWGAVAEAISKYMGKGRPIFVEGRLKLDQWEDKATKQQRYKLKVVVESFQFVDSKPEGAPAAQKQTSKPQQQTAQQKVDEQDDVPF